MKNARIIILAGQSNAVGVGHVKCLSKHFSEEKIKEYHDGYENIQINYNSHDKKSNGFVKTTVGCTEVTKNTVGPEVGIAERLTELYPNEELFIVKCAFGGANLYHDWLSPSSREKIEKDNEEVSRLGWCYDELIKILDESITVLKGRGYAPKICSFCWMQGESDAMTPDHVEEYTENYSNMLADLKSSFKEYMDDCVYIDAGISEVWTHYKRINELKQEYAKAHKNCRYIDTVAYGLTTANEPEEEPDIAHYDSDCTIKLGRLFADEIQL